jgi:biotin-(acetyl-CoA carboxylase) ligase
VTGRRVQVDLDERVITGVTDGLDTFGFLRVRRDDGVRETVLTGSVRPLE